MLDQVEITLSSTEEHARQIKELQNANLRRNLSIAEQAEGFVTAEYSVEFLLQLQQTTPHVIAISNGVVVGYALAASREHGASHALLADMVRHIDARCALDGVPLRNMKYVLVAQLCVAKAFRGQRLAQKLYAHFTQAFQERGFQCAVTDVVSTNAPSLAAHRKAGWVVVNSLEFEGVAFDVICLPLFEQKTLPSDEPKKRE
ncbi:acyl-CoA N-acyltransferase [Chytriomyces sp. MP71]|nr:acyl-CoA N-acyltransferase [Chytriomyces sp. MP71]